MCTVYGVSLRGNGNLLKLYYDEWLDNHECTKKYWIIHLKRVNFMVCEPHLNKTVKKKKKNASLTAKMPWFWKLNEPTPEICYFSRESVHNWGRWLPVEKSVKTREWGIWARKVESLQLCLKKWNRLGICRKVIVLDERNSVSEAPELKRQKQETLTNIVWIKQRKHTVFS